jgi:hypothetical protein
MGFMAAWGNVAIGRNFDGHLRSLVETAGQNVTLEYQVGIMAATPVAKKCFCSGTFAAKSVRHCKMRV